MTGGTIVITSSLSNPPLNSYLNLLQKPGQNEEQRQQDLVQWLQAFKNTIQ
jgi:hypothetical protein